MQRKFITWWKNDGRPLVLSLLIVCFLALFVYGVYVAIDTLILSAPQNESSESLEDVKDARYVIYTSGGEMKAVEYSTIIDMENGYQYRVFEIDGQYVCVPAIDADGTVYKTVE